jgi:hypothetical protein
MKRTFAAGKGILLLEKEFSCFISASRIFLPHTLHVVLLQHADNGKVATVS